jgi:hypothetical protein
VTAPAFPPRVYVTLETDGDAEGLAVAFFAEDCDAQPIGVYELVSVGRNETRFVETVLQLEQYASKGGRADA